MAAEHNLEGLRATGITHVLQVAEGLCPSHPDEGLSYRTVHVSDTPGEDLVAHFPACFEFINQAHVQGASPSGPPWPTAANTSGAALQQYSSDGGGDSDSMSWSGGCCGWEARSAAGAAAASASGGGEEATSSWAGLDGGAVALGPQQHAPILSETGREGFMQCALDDGSSFLCPRCGGVVLAARRQQHEAFWCEPDSGR
ncbi:hypothetical protein GPECTOR_14g212 [Gonium pectorale]|uniref:C2HC zinc finger plants domain-containing protein n=1 Tax=Gonium pectorale TaxID=33097 RepID=A0A150GM89_GONPE|nr:hypothetical protein GPECTOR_14g212 [Gonium pectorale]|eukprot:KXZ50969.1 hypothetical protein GPECTOR_14g212 [Gonium pectorale]